MGAQGFLKLFLSRRIDSLTDKNRFSVKNYRMCIRSDDCVVFRLNLGRSNFSTHSIAHCLDVGRSCSAAAAKHCCAKTCNFFHGSGEIGRGNVVNCFSAFRTWKSRIRTYNNRNTCIAAKLFNNSQHLVRAKTAVYTYGISAKSFHCCDNSHRVGAS